MWPPNSPGRSRKKSSFIPRRSKPEIADDIVAVDNAMKWGFNWDLGPFEMWDAIGVENPSTACAKKGRPSRRLWRSLLSSGTTSFYEREDGEVRRFYVGMASSVTVEEPKSISLARLKEQGQSDRKPTSGASLIDIGDDVACWNSIPPKMPLGADIIMMINAAVKEVSANYRGLVIGNQGTNFCVGANLMLMLMEAQDQNWPEIDLMVQPVPEDDGSPPLPGQSGGGRSLWHGPGRRRGSLPPGGPHPGGGGNLHGPGGSGRWSDSRRRRKQGVAPPLDGKRGPQKSTTAAPAPGEQSV